MKQYQSYLASKSGQTKPALYYNSQSIYHHNTFPDKRSDKYCSILEKKASQNAPGSFDDRLVVQPKSQMWSLARKRDSNRLTPENVPIFRELKLLGSGAQGTVTLVIQNKTSTIYALKTIPKHLVNQHSIFYLNEIKIHLSLKHENIVQLYHVYPDAHSINLVLQYAHESLLTYLNRKKKLTQSETSHIVKQLLRALDYIHTRKIIHRDIKLQNVLFIHGTVKLCDFGFSKIDQFVQSKELLGTVDYLSPEIVSSTHYTQKTDIWAIGVIAYELIHGKHLLEGSQKNKIDFLRNFSIENISLQGSQIFQSFVKAVLVRHEKRPQAYQLLKHQFILKYQS